MGKARSFFVYGYENKVYVPDNSYPQSCCWGCNLSESVDIGPDGVGCTDQVQGTASPGLKIARVVIVQHALAGINPETLRYQERSTERVPVDALGVLVAAGGGLTDAADAVITETRGGWVALVLGGHGQAAEEEDGWSQHRDHEMVLRWLLLWWSDNTSVKCCCCSLCLHRSCTPHVLCVD